MRKTARSSTSEECSAPEAKAAPLTPQLAALEARISRCRICCDAPLCNPLPHEPRPVIRLSSTARMLIAGQAPGTKVHASGMPFTDPSGDRLRAWLGIAPDIFYDANCVAIVPMGFCFPGQDARKADLPPRRECREAWHDQIMRAMPQIETIFVIGAYARDYHFARTGVSRANSQGMTQTVRNWREYANLSPRLFPLPHPSWRNTGWLKRNPWFEEDVLPAVRAEVRRLLDAR